MEENRKRYYEEETNISPRERERSRYRNSQSEETILGIPRHTAYTIFVWTFRVISLFFVFLLWKLVLAPFVPVVKPICESLFVTQTSPLKYMGGILYVGGVDVLKLRELIILGILKFIVLTFGLTVVRLVKRMLYKAIFM